MDDAQSEPQTAPEAEVLGAPDLDMLRTLISHLNGMAFRCRGDAASTMEYVSEACSRLTGYPPKSLLNNSEIRFANLVHGEDREARQEAIALAMQTRQRYDIEYRLQRADGAIRWMNERGAPVYERDADGAYLVGLLEDITERKRIEEALEELELRCQEDVTERRRFQAHIEHQANFDALTGLANRALLDDRLRQAIKQAEVDGGRVTVALVDLDQFKLINDSFGHQLGDALLRTIAERLKACVRDTDTVGRQGGDEFVLILRNYADDEAITGIMQRVQALIAQPWSAGRRELHVTSSIGIAVYPQDGRSADILMRNADSAMYKAKEHGRNNYQFFTAELNRLIFERLSVERRLRSALVRKQFVLHYQSRINVRTGRIVAAEALLRWRAPQGGLYGPARFIAVAENTGLIVPIGKWVLRTACDQARSWQIQGLRSIMISVNVSPRQFRESDMVQTVAEALEQSGLPARCLQLELTESMMMGDAEKYIAMLRELKQMGVHLAVDDFGTGYSSLSYLKRFPVDHLKIDRAFVKDIATDPDDGAIVQTIIQLGHKLGMRVVAEGVETEEQREYLYRCRCDEMQGYYFSKPIPAAEFGSMLADSRADLADGRADLAYAESDSVS